MKQATYQLRQLNKLRYFRQKRQIKKLIRRAQEAPQAQSKQSRVLQNLCDWQRSPMLPIVCLILLVFWSNISKQHFAQEAEKHHMNKQEYIDWRVAQLKALYIEKTALNDDYRCNQPKPLVYQRLKIISPQGGGAGA